MAERSTNTVHNSACGFMPTCFTFVFCQVKVQSSKGPPGEVEQSKSPIQGPKDSTSVRKRTGGSWRFRYHHSMDLLTGRYLNRHPRDTSRSNGHDICHARHEGLRCCCPRLSALEWCSVRRTLEISSITSTPFWDSGLAC